MMALAAGLLWLARLPCHCATRLLLLLQKGARAAWRCYHTLCSQIQKMSDITQGRQQRHVPVH